MLRCQMVGLGLRLVRLCGGVSYFHSFSLYAFIIPFRFPLAVRRKPRGGMREVRKVNCNHEANVRNRIGKPHQWDLDGGSGMCSLRN